MRTVKNNIFLMVIFFASFGFMHCCHATSCTASGTALTSSVSVSFSKEDPVGTESAPIGNLSNILTCNPLFYVDGSFYYQYYIDSATAVAGMPGVYPTNLAGVGIKYYTSVESFAGFNSCTSGADFIPSNVPRYTGYNIAHCGYTSQVTSSSLTIKIIPKLVKTSMEVTGGTVTSAPSLKASYFDNDKGTYETYVDAITVTPNDPVIVPTCSIITSTLSIDMGTIAVNQFSNHAGFVLNKTAKKDIIFNCIAGTSIHVTLNGTQNPDVADTSVLQLLSGSGTTATGVGLQLLYDDTPLKLNEDTTLKTAEGTNVAATIAARYYQTLDRVTPGSANGIATLNVTYK
jgi:type 1 fimbria pilin